MTKEYIDSILKENEDIANDIKRIAEHYTLSDFVKAPQNVWDHFVKSEFFDNHIGWYIYDNRNDYLCMYSENTGYRLTSEYANFLRHLLNNYKAVDTVFYIVAYHYLSLGKQLGYDLTGDHYSRFPFFGDKMSPLAQKRYKKLQIIHNDNDLYDTIKSFDEKDLNYYNHFHRIIDCYHHATKYFSLLNYLIHFDSFTKKYEFHRRFEDALDLFIFRYKIIFTDQLIHSYTEREIIDSLVDYKE